MQAPKFLTAEWRKLIMANYAVDPAILHPFVPANTEPDSWNGQTYVSLVGFMFLNTRVRGMRIPFHINFPEVNLRFYVRYRENQEWKRGVVFIREIVPRPALTFVANRFFGERYITLPMQYSWKLDNETIGIRYAWKSSGRWNSIEVQAKSLAVPWQGGSEEEFITEHYWGYTSIGPNKTGEYKVEHPRWEIYPVHGYSIDCDFGGLYGKSFESLSGAMPASVFLAEGSAISVFRKKII